MACCPQSAEGGWQLRSGNIHANTASLPSGNEVAGLANWPCHRISCNCRACRIKQILVTGYIHEMIATHEITDERMGPYAALSR